MHRLSIHRVSIRGLPLGDTTRTPRSACLFVPTGRRAHSMHSSTARVLHCMAQEQSTAKSYTGGKKTQPTLFARCSIPPSLIPLRYPSPLPPFTTSVISPSLIASHSSSSLNSPFPSLLLSLRAVLNCSASALSCCCQRCRRSPTMRLPASDRCEPTSEKPGPEPSTSSKGRGLVDWRCRRAWEEGGGGVQQGERGGGGGG